MPSSSRLVVLRPLECQVPPHAQDNNFLVEMPTLKRSCAEVNAEGMAAFSSRGPTQDGACRQKGRPSARSARGRQQTVPRRGQGGPRAVGVREEPPNHTTRGHGSLRKA
jgi:hypothetical protein